MFNLGLAGLKISVDNKYPYIEKMCADYIIGEGDCDFSVSVTEEEIMREATEECGEAAYLESLAVYRKIAEKIIEYDGFLLHGVVLETAGQGVAFCAKSGTGKSTHAALWMRYLGDKCTIINGDKPLIRIINGEVYAYGTPWCGKEGINKNAKTNLKAVCILERGAENEISPLAQNEVFPYMTTQLYLPKLNGVKLLKTLDLADRFIRSTAFYKLKCNMDISAAETAYNAIIK